MSPGPEAEDENVPVARSIERAVVTALSDAARSGVTKYAYDGICSDSAYSFAALLSKSKADMEKYGYYRKGGWAIIQRSIDSRALQEFNHKFYGAPPPKTAAMKLPTPKPLFEGWAIPAANRPQTANF